MPKIAGELRNSGQILRSDFLQRRCRASAASPSSTTSLSTANQHQERLETATPAVRARSLYALEDQGRQTA
ncbi:MAG: hypothetical protein QOJ46_1996 [bacterium]|jgi:hypothetical protein